MDYNMIDIHTHILPGIDDGSSDITQTKKMLDIMARQGVKKIVATPHFYSDVPVSEFVKRRDDAYSAVRTVMTDGHPSIALGAEVYLEYEMHKVPDLRKLCIKNTDYMLVELPYCNWDDWVYDELYKISITHDVNIIIAHLDRYIDILYGDNPHRLLAMNYKIQVNADSLGGRFKKSYAYRLIESGIADFIASDCHDECERFPCLLQAKKVIEKRLGGECFSNLMKNAGLVLDNEDF